MDEEGKKPYLDKHSADQIRYNNQLKELNTNGFFIMDDGTKSNDQTNILKKRKSMQNKVDKKAKKSNKIAKKAENAEQIKPKEETEPKIGENDEAEESQDE